MNLTRCSNGHFYDAECLDSCPFCEEEQYQYQYDQEWEDNWDLFGGIFITFSPKDFTGQTDKNRLLPWKVGDYCLLGHDIEIHIDEASETGCSVTVFNGMPLGKPEAGEGLSAQTNAVSFGHSSNGDCPKTVLIGWGEELKLVPSDSDWREADALSIRIKPTTDFSEKGEVTGFEIRHGYNPTIDYCYSNGKLKSCSWKGDMLFDCADDIMLSRRQKHELYEILHSIPFADWQSDPIIARETQIRMAEDCADEVYFSCKFENGDGFWFAPVGEKPEEYERLFEFLFSICPLQTEMDASSSDPVIMDLAPHRKKIFYTKEEGVSLYDVAKGREWHVKKDCFYAGRNGRADLYLAGSGVARMTAVFYLHHSVWLLEDCYSRNGTWLNGVKLSPRYAYVLHPDDVIDFGHEEKFIFFKTPMRRLSGQE